MQLGEQTWNQVDGGTHLLVPLGSTEQHGPHLPLDTDARIAESIARRVAAVTGATVAPVLAYGASGEHQAFAGTLSIGTDVLRAVIVELVRSAGLTFDQITLVNGHGGNHQAVNDAVTQMLAEGHTVTSWSPVIPDGDAHAGRTETSMMLAIAPHLVRLDLAKAGNAAPVRDLIDEMRDGGVIAVSANGVLGDPTGASVREGEAILSKLVADLAARVP